MQTQDNQALTEPEMLPALPVIWARFCADHVIKPSIILRAWNACTPLQEPLHSPDHVIRTHQLLIQTGKAAGYFDLFITDAKAKKFLGVLDRESRRSGAKHRKEMTSVIRENITHTIRQTLKQQSRLR